MMMALWTVVVLAIAGGIAYAVYSLPPAPIAPVSAANVPVAAIPVPAAPALPQPGAPSVVTSASVIPSDSAAVVTGAIDPNGAFTTYWYEYGTSPDAALPLSSPRQMIGSGYASTPAFGYITGLSSGASYYFRLVGENQYGRVSGLRYPFQTTRGNPPPAGSVPTPRSSAATGITRTAATLNGTVNPNRASTQYWFEYGTTPSLGNASALEQVGDGSAPRAVSVSLSDLNPSSAYYFRLNAQNQFGTANGAILSFKTAGSSAAADPYVVTGAISSIGASSATLHGSVNPNGMETSYWFEYAPNPPFGVSLSVSTARQSIGAGTAAFPVAASVSGLKPKTGYYVRLVAQGSSGIVYGDRKSFKTD